MKKELSSLQFIPAKYEQKCMTESNPLSSRQFFKTFLNYSKNLVFFIVVKNEKIDKIGLNYHRYMVKPLVSVLWSVLCKNTKGKKFLNPDGVISPLLQG